MLPTGLPAPPALEQRHFSLARVDALLPAAAPLSCPCQPGRCSAVSVAGAGPGPRRGSFRSTSRALTPSPAVPAVAQHPRRPAPAEGRAAGPGSGGFGALRSRFAAGSRPSRPRPARPVPAPPARARPRPRRGSAAAPCAHSCPGGARRGRGPQAPLRPGRAGPRRQRFPRGSAAGVHESKGVSEDYLKLESLIQKVVSPYLGTYGLYSSDGPFMHSACILEKRFFRRSKSGDILAKNPVVRSKSYNNPLLTPVAEYETESMAANGAGIRRHSVSEMTSCLELQGYSNLTTVMDNGSKSSVTTAKSSLPRDQERPSPGSVQCTSKLSTAEQQKGFFHSLGDPHRSFELGRDTSLLPVPSSSPENIVDQILESMDSDSEGIFIDFGRGCSSSSAYNVDVNRQSIV
ncbi:proline-rich protein 5 isoform X5 [Taeniopygia guttata]|uniref:proline-rich protein 5 isoform X5 n=1 Tax=Taeniopygia guttata TaxID=59729 RepID=UPI003BB934B8